MRIVNVTTQKFMHNMHIMIAMHKGFLTFILAYIYVKIYMQQGKMVHN